MHNLVYQRTHWNNDEYHIHFDIELDNNSSTLKGWFVNKGKNELRLGIFDNNKEEVFSDITCMNIRPKLEEMYPQIKDVVYSGFIIDKNLLSSDKTYHIYLYQKKKKIFKFLSLVNNMPLLYVHIAKTAGSTVNKVVSEWFGEPHSLIHAESENNLECAMKERDIKFLSGHIPYVAFIKQQEELQNYKKAITFREPLSHVISHLSWIRSLSLPENKARYDQHPEYIKNLSDKLSAYDLSCPNKITELIESFNASEKRLLDNTQTRYIRTEIGKVSVDHTDVFSAVENLTSFNFLGVDSDIAKFLANIASDCGFEYKEEDRRENVLIEKFGLDINNTDIRNSLLPLIIHDLKLYDLVNIEVQERELKKKMQPIANS
jgi:hypothetical protein